MMRTSVALATFLFATMLHAQAPTSFAKGVLAFEQKDWKTAEKLMRETIAANPKESEGTVSIAGSWYETYVPHYFLARALARQGKCDEALKEFAETERQGVTSTIPDFARHLQTRGGCKPQAKPAKPKEIVFETTVPFAEEGTRTTTTTRREVVVPTRDLARASATRARLAVAITAYLHGRYDETVRLLTETKFDDRVAIAEASLFRAAANHALYRSGGEKDEALRARIDADLRQYRNLAPSTRPDPRIFPPGFIALTR